MTASRNIKRWSCAASLLLAIAACDDAPTTPLAPETTKVAMPAAGPMSIQGPVAGSLSIHSPEAGPMSAEPHVDHLMYSMTLLNKAVTLTRAGRHAEALPPLDQSIQMRRDAAAADPIDWEAAHRLASACYLRGSVAQDLGHEDEARSAFTEACDIWERLVKKEGHTQLGDTYVRALIAIGRLG